MLNGYTMEKAWLFMLLGLFYVDFGDFRIPAVCFCWHSTDNTTIIHAKMLIQGKSVITVFPAAASSKPMLSFFMNITERSKKHHESWPFDFLGSRLKLKCNLVLIGWSWWFHRWMNLLTWIWNTKLNLWNETPLSIL